MAWDEGNVYVLLLIQCVKFFFVCAWPCEAKNEIHSCAGNDVLFPGLHGKMIQTISDPAIHCCLSDAERHRWCHSGGTYGIQDRYMEQHWLVMCSSIRLLSCQAGANVFFLKKKVYESRPGGLCANKGFNKSIKSQCSPPYGTDTKEKINSEQLSLSDTSVALNQQHKYPEVGKKKQVTYHLKI